MRPADPHVVERKAEIAAFATSPAPGHRDRVQAQLLLVQVCGLVRRRVILRRFVVTDD